MYNVFSPLLSQTKIRYEVNFQNGIECGGAYVKLLSKTPELNLVSNATTSKNLKFFLCFFLKKPL